MSDAKAAKAREHELLFKIRELEKEVHTLKNRLDELRKAKNTTLIKREREIVEQVDGAVSASRANPRSGNSSSSRSREDVAAGAASCDHEPILHDLKLQVADMESQNTALAIENSELHERVRALTNELSLREAKWCEREEEMKTVLQKKWEQMYAEWMRTTEGKISELQAANELLRTMLSSNR